MTLLAEESYQNNFATEAPLIGQRGRKNDKRVYKEGKNIALL